MPPLPHCCAEMPPGCAPGEGGTAASRADMRPPQCMGGPRAAHSSPCRIVINWRNVYFLIPWWGRQQRRWWGEGWGPACPLLPPACGLQQIVVLPLRCLPCWPGALTKKKKKSGSKAREVRPSFPQCLSPLTSPTMPFTQPPCRCQLALSPGGRLLGAGPAVLGTKGSSHRLGQQQGAGKARPHLPAGAPYWALIWGWGWQPLPQPAVARGLPG